MQGVKPHTDRTLIERTVWRVEYLSHQMLLATRENEVDIWGKLHVRPQQCLSTCFRIIDDLLELINGYIDVVAALFQIIEYRFQRHLRLRCFDAD